MQGENPLESTCVEEVYIIQLSEHAISPMLWNVRVIKYVSRIAIIMKWSAGLQILALIMCYQQILWSVQGSFAYMYTDIRYG
jgi:hypothetical protein